MPSLSKILDKIDNYQQNHRWLGFGYAVVKKYGEEGGGYHAALLTYYAFLALFPLMLLLTTVSGLLLADNAAARQTITDGLTDYFPVLGNQLAGDVDRLRGGGLAILAGLLFTLYGTRGVADAWRRSVHEIWQVPRSERAGFPRAHIKSLIMVVVGGLGFILASVSASLVSTGHGVEWRVMSVIVNLFILFGLFIFLVRFNLPRQTSFRATGMAAAVAAVGLVVLQAIGGYLLAHELRNLDALYSYFAIPLGLLFWLYLQAQVLVLAIVISSVKAKRHWPRSLKQD